MEADVAVQPRQEEPAPKAENPGAPAPVPSCEVPTPIHEGQDPSQAETSAGPPGELSDGMASGLARGPAVKLVLTLKPGDGPAAMQVVMAIGADGCDPLLRSAEVEDLQAALDLVPGLLAEAEARWQSQPRYPHVHPRAGARSASSRAKEVSQPPRDEQIATSGSQQPAQQSLPPKPSSSQLSLFG